MSEHSQNQRRAAEVARQAIQMRNRATELEIEAEKLGGYSFPSSAVPVIPVENREQTPETAFERVWFGMDKKLRFIIILQPLAITELIMSGGQDTTGIVGAIIKLATLAGG